MLTVAIKRDHTTHGQKGFKARAKLKNVPPESSRSLGLNNSNSNNKVRKKRKKRKT